MSTQFLQPLSLGTSSFSALRTANQIYVDKTDLVFELARSVGKIFLARPRRFGKSLLLSTFESLFRDGLKYFSGLAIEKQWTDKTYDVIRLDFSEVMSFARSDIFEARFVEMVATKIRRIEPTFDCTVASFNARLSELLEARPVLSLVILIDEYDSPLTEAMDDPNAFGRVRTVLNAFFLTLKANDSCLRFLFMTGITKFSNTGIFPAFNNLRDISLTSDYSAILGYTEREIRDNFGPYLERAQKKLGVSAETLMKGLAQHYDGFCFDKTAQTHVFCPWSVLNFLMDPASGFENYWYRSAGRPNVLLRYLTHHTLNTPAGFNQSVAVPLSDLSAACQYDEISVDTLLTQSGYYTIRTKAVGDSVLVGYPNLEVARSMAQLYADEILGGNNTERAR